MTPTMTRAAFDVDDDAEALMFWQQCLYFLPLPHSHGSFLPGVLDIFAPWTANARWLASAPGYSPSRAAGAMSRDE